MKKLIEFLMMPLPFHRLECLSKLIPIDGSDVNYDR